MPGTPLPADGPEITGAASQTCADPTVVVDGIPVCAESGPDWLVRLMFAPPEWLGLALKLLIVAVVALVALGYYRHGIDEDVLRESAENGLTWLSVLVLATALRGTGIVPGGYVGTVVAAGVGGFVLSRGLVVAVSRLDERREGSVQ